MNWADTMKQNASRVSRDRIFTDPGDLQCAASTAWDPREVWLTRVKQPRDRAAVRAMAAALNQPGKQQD